jgi:hypothetical protein
MVTFVAGATGLLEGATELAGGFSLCRPQPANSQTHIKPGITKATEENRHIRPI